VYRVTRSRSKQTKAGKTDLSFMAQNNSFWTPIGGAKLSETQEAIKSVLNADYELCANSNFLIQGHADLFSTATPAERKAILAQVLCLDEYALLKSAANKKWIHSGSVVETLETEVGPLEILTNSLMEINRLITSSEANLERVSGAQLQIATEMQQHHEEKGKKQGALNEILEVKQGLAQLYKDQDELETKIATNILDQEYYQALLGRKESIEKQFAILEDVTQCLSLEKDKEVGLMKGILEIENEIRVSLERKNREDETLRRVEGELQSFEHKRELIESEHKVERNKLGDGISQAMTKGKLLEVVPCYEELQKKCQFTLDAVQSLEGLPAKKQQLMKLEVRNFLQEQLPNYEKDHATRIEQIKNLTNTVTDEKLRELRDRRETATLTKGKVTKVVQELDDKRKLSEPLAKQKPELDSVIKEVEKLIATCKGLNEMLHRINNEIQVKLAKTDEETTLATWLSEALHTEEKLKNKDSYYQGEITGTTERLGSLRQQGEQAKAAQVSLNALKEKLDAVRANHTTAKTLAGYYASIPVMIMEGAVPTLELATNGILEKISPSGMRVRLETQKALKSSDKIGETLDILVRDVFGEKPYENYSGGEKFRLDLALRFGLSQLLMHRAGSRMETLIIDEGLGSLDADGLALLRECLSKLETSFGLILVISHVEEIQGTFEQEILVEKNAFGSEIKVL
jgi:exonuclease SbcC